MACVKLDSVTSSCLFCRFNKERLHSLVTERCYPVSKHQCCIQSSSVVVFYSSNFLFQEMTRGNRYKTIRWRFVESLELPKVVHARCPDMVSKGNLYGQVTVRMHSKQVHLAVTQLLL